MTIKPVDKLSLKAIPLILPVFLLLLYFSYQPDREGNRTWDVYKGDPVALLIRRWIRSTVAALDTATDKLKIRCGTVISPF